MRYAAWHGQIQQPSSSRPSVGMHAIIDSIHSGKAVLKEIVQKEDKDQKVNNGLYGLFI